MSTYSNHVPSGVTEVIRYNYGSNVNGASLKSSITACFNNNGGSDATVQVWVTLNSGDTSGQNNTNGWRGDGKNADVLVEQRRISIPPGQSTTEITAFFDGIYSGYGVLSVWAQADTSTSVLHIYTRVVTDITKA